MLDYIYEQGGAVYKQLEFTSELSYQIAECENGHEFDRVMTAMKAKGWVNFRTGKGYAGIRYFGVTLTEVGLAEAKKSLPQIPMIGLIDQAITTGDIDVDAKINHARRLFFSDPPTNDNMRSACETLSYVLEPMRDELSKVISAGDVNAFFELVNKFDIRHNKEHTKSLVYTEQLEWVFYGLLNTINTYTKLKSRLLHL